MSISHPSPLGALLPHFGSSARPDAIRDVATAASRAGAGSLWVRDHLLYGPHGMEDPDPTFLETFTTLGYATAHAPDLDLGTAAVVPIRHPLVLAKAAATIAALTGGQLHLGIGAGFRDSEFEPIGLHTDLAARARQVVPATFEILRMLRAGEDLRHHGDHWDFGPVQQSPGLPADTRFLYCGTSPLAYRLAVEHAEGWVPGRINIPTLERRLNGARPEDFDVVVVPLVAVGASREDAARKLDLPSLLEYANGHRWLEGPDGHSFETADDLEGIILHGRPDDIAAGVARLRQAGATRVVLDLRLNWDEAPAELERILPTVTRLGR